MPRNHTNDPGISAQDAGDHALLETWRRTGNSALADQAGIETESGMLREQQPFQEFPPCINSGCEMFGSSGRVGESSQRNMYYCYECCQTF
jgi:hypothetical protein